METLQILVLSLVQGITEFLPISSSGHLILVPMLTEWNDQGLLFDISVHVGTLGAVMLYFRKDVVKLVIGTLQILSGKAWGNKQTAEASLTLRLALSTLPLVFIAPLIKDLVENYARNLSVIATTSIIFGLLLYIADRLACNQLAGTQLVGFKFSKLKAGELDSELDNKENPSLATLTYKQSLVFGLFQVVAMIPGTSRSGICMTAGRFLGFSRQDSSHYSMLMAIPVIMMIGLSTLLFDFTSGVTFKQNLSEISLGILLSFISALGAIHLLMKSVEKIGFLPFVIYRVLLGIGLFTLII